MDVILLASLEHVHVGFVNWKSLYVILYTVSIECNCFFLRCVVGGRAEELCHQIFKCFGDLDHDEGFVEQNKMETFYSAHCRHTWLLQQSVLDQKSIKLMNRFKTLLHKEPGSVSVPCSFLLSWRVLPIVNDNVEANWNEMSFQNLDFQHLKSQSKSLKFMTRGFFLMLQISGAQTANSSPMYSFGTLDDTHLLRDVFLDLFWNLNSSPRRFLCASTYLKETGLELEERRIRP